MNLKTTILLLVLGGGCVALFWKGPELAQLLRIAPKPEVITDRGTVADLRKLSSLKLTRVTVLGSDGKEVVLEAKKPGDPLELPGNWPVRRYEVDELLELLKNLKSRFHPIALADDADMKLYGLDPSQKPVVVTATLSGEAEPLVLTLTFGQEDAKPGTNSFVRPCYVRVGEKKELLRLGSDAMLVLRRTEEAYRRRQLFPEIARLKVATTSTTRTGNTIQTIPTVMLPSNDVTRIAVDTPTNRYVLQRVADNPVPQETPDDPNADPHVTAEQLAESWIMVEPVRDRLEPSKLRALLVAIPELIVDKFDDKATLYNEKALPKEAFFAALSLAQASVPGSDNFASIVASLCASMVKTPKLTLTFKNNDQRTVYIGKTARSTQRIEMEPPPNPMMQPRPRLIREESLFAWLPNNPQIFDLNDERLNDIFFNRSGDPLGPPSSVDAVAALRDPRVLRFDADDVKSIRLEQKAKDPLGKSSDRILELTRFKGDKKAKTDEAKRDRWEMNLPVKESADTPTSADLVDLFKGMEGTGGNVIEVPALRAALAMSGLTSNHLDWLDLSPERAKKIVIDTTRKSYTLHIGKKEGTDKRYVLVPGWDRIYIVDDKTDAGQVSKLDRQPSSYLSLKPLDPLKSKVGSITVQRPKTSEREADSYTLKPEQPDPNKPEKWMVTAPFRADTDRDAAAFTSAVGNLANLKYIYNPKIDAPLVSSKTWPRFTVGIAPFAQEVNLGDESFFGLDKPFTIRVTHWSTEPKWPEEIAFTVVTQASATLHPEILTIEIGRARTATEHYARLQNTAGIFAVPETIATGADHKAEDLVDKLLIQLSTKPEVQTLQRTMNGQDLELTVQGGLWRLAKPVVADADATLVDEIVSAFKELRAARIQEIGAKDLKKYGLEPPVASVKLEDLQRGKFIEKTLQIGNPVNEKEPDGDRYARAEGSTTVAVIPGNLAKKLTAPAVSFRDRTFGEGFTSADKIAFDRGTRKLTFAKGPAGWKLAEPLVADAEDADLRELHDALAGKPKADEIVEDKPKDLSKYGLDKPDHLRFLRDDKEELHVLIGTLEKPNPEKKTAGGRAYVMLNKGSTVFLLNARLTHMLTDEYRKREAWPRMQPNQITEIAVKAVDPKDSFTLVKGPMGWSDPAKPGEKFDELLVDDLLFTLIGLRVDRYLVDQGATDLKPFGLDKPKTITITGAGGKKQTLLLGTLVDGKKLHAKVDDPARTDVFLLSEFDSKTFNRPRSDYIPAKKDDPKKDEPKKDDPKKDEPKKDDPKK